MPHFPRILLAATPNHTPLKLPFPTEPAHMDYRIGPHLQLLQTQSELKPEGGFLMISGTASCCLGNFNRFCQLVLDQCHARHAVGIVANWEFSHQSADLVRALDHVLSESGFDFWVPEQFAADAPMGTIMISSQLSGGTLSARLQEAQQRWGNRISLAIECTPWDFCLPCPSGYGHPLEERQVQQQLSAHNAHLWFSDVLCNQYFTYFAEGHLHLVQFDNASSIRKKLELAEHLKLSGAILSWDEIHFFAHELQSPTQRTQQRKT